MWVVETAVITAGGMAKGDESKDEDGVRVNTLTKCTSRPDLFLIQDVQRGTIKFKTAQASSFLKFPQLCKLIDKTRKTFSPFACFQHLIGRSFLSSLPVSPSQLFFFRLFNSSQVAYALFNDWLTSNKEALCYCMVQQAGETVLWAQRLSGSHGHSFDPAEIKTACSLCLCKFWVHAQCVCAIVCVGCFNYIRCIHKRTAEGSQCPNNVTCSWCKNLHICILKHL